MCLIGGEFARHMWREFAKDRGTIVAFMITIKMCPRLVDLEMLVETTGLFPLFQCGLLQMQQKLQVASC